MCRLKVKRDHLFKLTTTKHVDKRIGVIVPNTTIGKADISMLLLHVWEGIESQDRTGVTLVN